MGALDITKLKQTRSTALDPEQTGRATFRIHTFISYQPLIIIIYIIIIYISHKLLTHEYTLIFGGLYLLQAVALFGFNARIPVLTYRYPQLSSKFS